MIYYRKLIWRCLIRQISSQILATFFLCCGNEAEKNWYLNQLIFTGDISLDKDFMVLNLSLMWNFSFFSSSSSNGYYFFVIYCFSNLFVPPNEISSPFITDDTYDNKKKWMTFDWSFVSSVHFVFQKRFISWNSIQLYFWKLFKLYNILTYSWCIIIFSVFLS